MTTQLWVDGYNVIFADPELSALAKENIHAATSALIDLVAEYASLKGYTPWVFLDDKNNTEQTSEDEINGVKVIRGNFKNSADQLIERLNFETPKKQDIVLVTSDNLITSLVSYRTSQSRLIKSGEFRKELLRTRTATANIMPKNIRSLPLADQLSGAVKNLLEKLRRSSK